eukprot:TRINITY_DN6975_c0_g1_i1.p1 TRINITY_DN6975_c0_g1~~TRINITY_DN6975_c0_g1_i1.p1  ORF type:complete len:642 (-),score=86.34 TRINITY_DN6975_c0_g1_i1:121-2046(-)
MASWLRVGPLLTCLILVSSSLFSAANAVNLHSDDVSTLSDVIGNLTYLPTGWTRNSTQFVAACSWTGLACNSAGRLITFGLDSVDQGSTIPKAIGAFPSLSRLNLGSSNFIGTIPAEIFLPQNLSYVDLGSNYLVGTIPASVSNAVKMSTFRVGFNSLNGTLPSGMDAFTEIVNIDLGRNRFECPFPTNLYNRIKLANTTRDCQFWGNNWDLSYKDGKICGGTVDVPVGDHACQMFPYTTVQNVKRNQTSNVLRSPKLQIEVYDNYVALFPKFPSGAIYRDEYLSARFQAVELFDVVGAQAGFLSPPQVSHFATYPISKFDNITQIGEFKWEMHVYWPGQRIHELILHWDFNSSQTAGGVKFSASVLGQDNIFEGRSYPGALSLVANFEARGYMFSPNSRLTCSGSNSLYVGQTICGNELFNTTLELVASDTPTIVWTHSTRNIHTVMDSPFEFFADGRPTPLAWYPRRYSLSIPGYGASAGVRYAQFNDTVMVEPDDQGINVQFELLFSNVTRSLYWDPTISLSVLLPDPGLSPETSAPENRATLEEAQNINLAVAVGIPVAVIAVVAIVAVIALSPAIRRRFFPADAALHEIRRRQVAAGTIGQGPSSPAPAVAPPSPSASRSADWQRARPSVTTDPVV